MEIAALKEKILPILRQSGVRRASLFGSILEKPDFDSVNDVDILVELDKKASLLDFIDLKQKLEESIGKRIDLVEYETIKPALKKSILENQMNLIE